MSNTNLMPTRRTIIRTAAWTAPAVSLAVASPAFASSNPGVIGTQPSGTTPTMSSGGGFTLTTKLSSSVALTGTVTATIVVQVFKDNGKSSATPAFTVGSPWAPATGTSTYQMTNLPAGDTFFAPTLTFGSSNWDRFTATITFSGDGFQSFSVTFAYPSS